MIETLDHVLAIRKMAVIEGNSGIGKTTAVEAWCEAHQGKARLVSLSGISHKTGFFQKLATAIGLAASNRKATDMQVKVEEFFRRTGLMLVIDEAHYLWPQHQRSHSSPELVEWVNTALVNQRVPVALICTDQFAKLKARVEKRTGWNERTARTPRQAVQEAARYAHKTGLGSRSRTPLANALERFGSNMEPGRPLTLHRPDQYGCRLRVDLQDEVASSVRHRPRGTISGPPKRPFDRHSGGPAKGPLAVSDSSCSGAAAGV